MELENTLEQEQEALVNKLWKRMDKLEAEKRMLQIKLDQPVSDPASPRDISNGDTATNLSSHIQTLRSEVTRLRSTLAISQQEHTQKMQRYAQEERNIKEENLRLYTKNSFFRYKIIKIIGFCFIGFRENYNWRLNDGKLYAVTCRKVKVPWKWRKRGIITNKCLVSDSILFLLFQLTIRLRAKVAH